MAELIESARFYEQRASALGEQFLDAAERHAHFFGIAFLSAKAAPDCGRRIM